MTQSEKETGPLVCSALKKPMCTPETFWGGGHFAAFLVEAHKSLLDQLIACTSSTLQASCAAAAMPSTNVVASFASAPGGVGNCESTASGGAYIAGEDLTCVSPLMHGQVIPNETHRFPKEEEPERMYAAAS